MKKPFLITLILLPGAAVLLYMLVCAIFIPNSVRSRVGKINAIVKNLRYIQAAKEYWALEHHETNDIVITQQMLEEAFGTRGYDAVVRPVAGERYRINTLWRPAEAELTKMVDGDYPPGTVVRLGTNARPEIILPNQPGGAKGGQPFSSETNRTSSAAGSRR